MVPIGTIEATCAAHNIDRQPQLRKIRAGGHLQPETRLGSSRRYGVDRCGPDRLWWIEQHRRDQPHIIDLK